MLYTDTRVTAPIIQCCSGENRKWDVVEYIQGTRYHKLNIIVASTLRKVLVLYNMWERTAHSWADATMTSVVATTGMVLMLKGKTKTGKIITYVCSHHLCSKCTKKHFAARLCPNPIEEPVPSPKSLAGYRGWAPEEGIGKGRVGLRERGRGEK